MTDTTSPQFGDRVVATNLMHRVVSDDGRTKTWEPRPEYIKPKRPIEGIFLGYRTLQNGYTVFGGWEDPSEWHQTSNVRVALVSPGADRNPVYVPVEDVLTAAEFAARTNDRFDQQRDDRYDDEMERHDSEVWG